MDASQITKLLQKQNTRYIKRNQSVDSSTMIWRNQIQSSKYVKGVATCTGLINTNVPTQLPCMNEEVGLNRQSVCTFGGQGKDTTLSTGSTKRYPNVYAGASGSASQVYSSEHILLQKAGRNYCAELITEQEPYAVLPHCFTVNTNGPTSDNPTPAVNNNNTNPYLPPFDTYYKFKNPLAQNTERIPDQNSKHFVMKYNSRFPNVHEDLDGCIKSPEN